MKYFIKESYKENLNNSYYEDVPIDNIVWQPDVYRYAIEYAKKNDIRNIIDIGSGNGEKLLNHKDIFNITFIDYGSNLEIIKQKFMGSVGKHTYIEQDFEKSFPKISPKIIINSVVICSDVIEHVRNLDNLSYALTQYSKMARFLIISTPERERAYGFNQSGIPGNLCHVREWKLDEFDNYLTSLGMDYVIGLTRSNDRSNQRSTLCVLSGRDISIKKDFKLQKKIDKSIQAKIINKKYLIEILKEENIRIPKFDEKFCGLYNPYPDNYMLYHFIKCLRDGASYGVNKFKFITQDTYYRSVDLTNIDCSLLQCLGETQGEYPVAFTFMYEGELLSKGIDDRLLTISAQHLAINYLPETVLGFYLLDKSSDTLALLPNYTNMAEEHRSHLNIRAELESYMGVKRSAKLLLGNIKRRIKYSKKDK